MLHATPGAHSMAPARNATRFVIFLLVIRPALAALQTTTIAVAHPTIEGPPCRLEKRQWRETGREDGMAFVVAGTSRRAV